MPVRSRQLVRHLLVIDLVPDLSHLVDMPMKKNSSFFWPQMTKASLKFNLDLSTDQLQVQVVRYCYP